MSSTARRSVSEGAFDLLLLETINSVRKKYKDNPQTAIETLDAMGFNIGRRLVEKFVVSIVVVVAAASFFAPRTNCVNCALLLSLLLNRTAQDRNRFNPQNSLDIIKFLCKDFWNETFGKQVDNLRTNHRVKQIAVQSVCVCVCVCVVMSF
jgi:hypothetical protein